MWTRLSLVPVPMSFSMYMRERGGIWDLISHDKRWHDIMKERQSTTVDFESVHQHKTQLFEAFKDPTTLDWRLRHHIFYRRWTGVLENMARLHTIFTICHPSYHIWGLHHSSDIGIPGSPSFSHVCWKRSRSLGTRLNYEMMKVLVLDNFNW